MLADICNLQMDTPNNTSNLTGEILNEYFLVPKFLTLIFAKTKNKTVSQIVGDPALTSQIKYIVHFRFGVGTMSTGTLQIHNIYKPVYDLNNKAKFVTCKSTHILRVCMILMERTTHNHSRLQGP